MAEIKYNISPEKTVILLKNFNEMAGTDIQVNVNGYVYPYTIEGKKELESDLEFGRRFIYETVLNSIKANALSNDRGRYHEEVAAISEIVSNIPDDLLT